MEPAPSAQLARAPYIMAGGRVGAPLLAALQSARSRRLSRRSAACLWHLPSSRRGCAGCGESQRAPRSTPRADACCFSPRDPAAAAAVATPRTDARRRSSTCLSEASSAPSLRGSRSTSPHESRFPAWRQRCSKCRESPAAFAAGAWSRRSVMRRAVVDAHCAANGAQHSSR